MDNFLIVMFADASSTEIALVITAVTGLVSAILSGFATVFAALAKWKSDENSQHLQNVSAENKANAGNIAKIEVATNSMKDALVKATGDAAFAEGKAAGKAGIIGPRGPTPILPLPEPAPANPAPPPEHHL